MNIIQMEILLHLYQHKADFDGAKIAAFSPDLMELEGSGMVEMKEDGAIVFALTDKGRAHIDLLLHVPLPVQIWATPKVIR